MKNFLKLIGIITLIMAIGFSMAACGEEEEEEGRLTIFGFDFEENRFLVEAEATTDEDVYLFAVKSYNERNDVITRGEIKNRRVTLEVWEHKGGEPTLYSGDDEDVEFTVYIFDTEDPAYDEENPIPNFVGEVTVTFVNGVGIASIEDTVKPYTTP
jgi:hypothetical protein